MIPPPSVRPHEVAWRVAERTLLPIWGLAAAVTMYPWLGRALHISGTLFTSYAADLTFPAWFYMLCRRRPASRVMRWLGRSAVLTAVSIFGVGVVSEYAQLLVPRFVTGTFDPFDIAAYGSGLLVCVIADGLTSRVAVPSAPLGEDSAPSRR